MLDARSPPPGQLWPTVEWYTRTPVQEDRWVIERFLALHGRKVLPGSRWSVG
jgi:hypothetical protein